ncbi:hypothetical protein OIDMADRAFT_57551 [Oidiodendron maius Zn]|uniref:Uncharacterized protein n=1 Tax=Oidiodendron maius (strain Zn) TaxID=913774 RepID=A0A0C3H3L8_OIDMZ|nr:hypothetical protein OIDMADRAFT_57551 [Oidiodendron maius Zn]
MLSQTNSGALSLERGPVTFLSLAPTTSASYPSSPKSPTQITESGPAGQQKTPVPVSPATEANIQAVPRAEEVAELLKTERSSSSGSDGSAKRGYLKLGPVHFGEGGGDWSEDVLSV